MTLKVAQLGPVCLDIYDINTSSLCWAGKAFLKPIIGRILQASYKQQKIQAAVGQNRRSAIYNTGRKVRRKIEMVGENRSNPLYNMRTSLW